MLPIMIMADMKTKLRMMIDTKSKLYWRSQLSRFKASKYKNAAPIEVKKEEHIKSVMVVLVVKMVDWIGLPKRCFCVLPKPFCVQGPCHWLIQLLWQLHRCQVRYQINITAWCFFLWYLISVFSAMTFFWFQCKVYGVQLGHPWCLPCHPSHWCARSTKQANNQNLWK